MSQQSSNTAPGDQLRRAVTTANIPTLLLVLVQITGDLRWIRPPFQPSKINGTSDNDTGGFDEATQSYIRDAAVTAIEGWLETGDVTLPDPSHELLREMLGVSMGEEIPLEYGAMIRAELGPMTQEPSARVEPVPDGFDALIVGAGVSGICAAIKFAERGINYRIVEKNEAIGGTWFENRYPGVGVDTPSHLYSFSFAPNEWPRYYSKGPEIRSYLTGVADRFGVTDRISFGTKVIESRFDPADQRWHTTVAHADGTEEQIVSNLLVSAVGALNTPKVPFIQGLESFAGPSFHTARWPADLDVTGQRVGIIGTGASAMQIVPAIAPIVDQLSVFQRSPQWVTPFEKLDVEVPDEIHWLMRSVPLYAKWYRVRLAWTFNDRAYAALQRDPDWPHPERSINATNDSHRRFFTRYMESELGDRRDELIDAMLPQYPPFGKRILMDHGWFRTFQRDNVHLITNGIKEITPTGIITVDGREHEIDVLVLSTGFDAVRFISSMDIYGPNGQTLREAWNDDDARAYLGTVVPGFPNFFTLYGPNLQPGHGGSLLFCVEAQVHYALSLLDAMFEEGAQSFDVRHEPYEQYNDRVDDANARMIWTHPGVDNYYKNKKGRVVVNLALRNVDYWAMTRSADPSEYTFGFERNDVSENHNDPVEVSS